MTTPYLGPRAAVLMGMLVGRAPQTVAELLALVRASKGVPAERLAELKILAPRIGGALGPALDALDDRAELETQLWRLASHGFVRCVEDGDATIWWAPFGLPDHW